LGNARLKMTPPEKLVSEGKAIGKMLWNPDYAIERNRALTGGYNISEKRKEIEDALKLQFPGRNVSDLTEAELDLFAANDPAARNSRFKEILDLERPEAIGGGGLKTSSVLGGTSKGTIPEKRYLTRPIMIGERNINPLAIQKELFDEPLFGEEGINTNLKRETALDEFDRLYNHPDYTNIRDTPEGRKLLLQTASKNATTALGGYGVDDYIPVPGGQPRKSAFNSELARWMLTAPDWTRRHFDLANKKLLSLGLDIGGPFREGTSAERALFKPQNLTDPALSPFRRYLGYDLAQLGLAGAATYGLTGHLPSRATDIFNIELPKNSDYSTRNVFTPASTEMDLPKTAFNILNSVGPQAGFYAPSTDDFDSISAFWRNRLHPLARTGLDLVQNRDWRGRPIMGVEAFSKPERDYMGNITRERPDIGQMQALENIGAEMGRNILPQAAEALASIYQGNIGVGGKKRLSPAAIYGQMMELPFRAYTPRYSQVETPFERRLNRRTQRYQRYFR